MIIKNLKAKQVKTNYNVHVYPLTKILYQRFILLSLTLLVFLTSGCFSLAQTSWKMVEMNITKY